MPVMKSYGNLQKLAGTNEASSRLDKVPIVMKQFASGTPQVANEVADALKNYTIIMSLA